LGWKGTSKGCGAMICDNVKNRQTRGPGKATRNMQGAGKME
jgi:hypothetical protein